MIADYMRSLPICFMRRRLKRPDQRQTNPASRRKQAVRLTTASVAANIIPFRLLLLSVIQRTIDREKAHILSSIIVIETVEVMTETLCFIAMADASAAATEAYVIQRYPSVRASQCWRNLTGISEDVIIVEHGAIVSHHTIATAGRAINVTACLLDIGDGLDGGGLRWKRKTICVGAQVGQWSSGEAIAVKYRNPERVRSDGVDVRRRHRPQTLGALISNITTNYAHDGALQSKKPWKKTAGDHATLARLEIQWS